MKLIKTSREEAVLYLTREKDEDALLDFITTSFVFPDNETVDEKEEPEVGSDEESLDAEDDEEEDEGKEFVAKVSKTLFSKLVVGFASSGCSCQQKITQSLK